MPTQFSRRSRNLFKLFTLFSILLLSSCSQAPAYPDPATPTTPTPAEPERNLRPAGSPDVFIIGFAGRCGAVDCDAPFGNKAYLDDAEDQTLQGLEATFEALGYTADYESYAATVAQSKNKNYDKGYWEAQQRLNRIQKDWIANFDDPTRLVLVGHSNGTVWASLLAMENPNITFDYGIYIDGVCNRWDEDNLNYGFWTSTNLIREFYSEVGELYPLTLSIYGKACNSYPIPGFGSRHIKDVVPWNITRGLEMQSNTRFAIDNASLEAQGKCPGPSDDVGVKDMSDNMRPDGSLVGLYIYRSEVQDHCELPARYGLAMQETFSFIRQNGLPNGD